MQGSTQQSPTRTMKEKAATFLNNPQHTYELAIQTANKLGTLNRILLVFTRRGHNFTSLTFRETKDKRFASVEIQIQGDDNHVGKIVKELKKLIDVVTVECINVSIKQEKPTIQTMTTRGERHVF